ncbi:FlhC family transcriptional regulator [Nitrosomonas mobilis]|uniref:FlhC family transcriptional regulator n=1 Tax=Nitrosomonas mobilis TaxID=51642 RepID=UPI000B7EC28D|nr:FlhC family transcriptional regulator [Nitrosomonas mobilis]
MLRAENIEDLENACELVKKGMRLTVVQKITGVNIKLLRKLWHELRSDAPSRGLIKHSVLGAISSYADASNIAGFLAIYKNITKKRGLSNYFEVDSKILLDALRDFELICKTHLDINTAYFAVRDVGAGVVTMINCQCCRAAYVYKYEHRMGNEYTKKCPFCKTMPVIKNVNVPNINRQNIAPNISYPALRSGVCKSQVDQRKP